MKDKNNTSISYKLKKEEGYYAKYSSSFSTIPLHIILVLKTRLHLKDIPRTYAQKSKNYFVQKVRTSSVTLKTFKHPLSNVLK